MTAVATSIGATSTPPPRHGQKRTGRRRPRWLVPRAAFLVAALPLIVAAVAIVVRAPAINWTSDRALTELAVREAARGRQLLMGGERHEHRSSQG